jgi:hypothetical protein
MYFLRYDQHDSKKVTNLTIETNVQHDFSNSLITSKAITGVSNGVGNANMFGTPSSGAFLWESALFKQGLLFCLTFMYVLLSFCFYIEKGHLLEYLSGYTFNPLPSFR